MKKRNSKHVAAAFLFAGCGALALSSCNDAKNLYDIGGPGDKTQDEYFDFTTESNISFDLNYGSYAANSLLSIYVNDPMADAKEGSNTPSGDANFMIFADKDGKFKGNVTLPSYAEGVWIYASAWGVPTITIAEVKDGKVTVDLTKDTKATKLATRVVDNPIATLVNSSKKLYKVMDFSDNYGGLNDVNGILSTGDIPADDVKALQQTLWNGESEKPNTLDNSAFKLATDKVNTEIATTFVDDDGNTQTVTEAELWITFLTESGWNESTLGYYYYPVGQVPTSADDVEKFIIIPNVSVSGNEPYGAKGNQSRYFSPDSAPNKLNNKFQLLFKDPTTNKLTTHFPPGYVIGYFLISNGFQTTRKAGSSSSSSGRWPWSSGSSSSSSYDTSSNGYIDASQNFLYSNNEWNSDGDEHFMAAILNKENGTVVYGIEDGGDNTFEDVLFVVNGDPKYVIQDHGLPVIDKTNKEMLVTEYTYKTYAFEDMWPTGGDYDLNDVIVGHRRAITFGNNNNDVKTIEDVFTFKQPAGAATYTDAFAVKYPDFGASISFSSADMIKESETNSVIVTEDAMASRGWSCTVTRTFSGVSKTNFSEEINPFVISKYVKGADNRLEVHLPKHEATSKADAEKSNTRDDAWYIDAKGNYPFAISLPIQSFTPSDEGTPIDAFYTKYASWVESDGEKDADWYMYPKTSTATDAQ